MKAVRNYRKNGSLITYFRHFKKFSEEKHKWRNFEHDSKISPWERIRQG